jgi:hypothetical protein
MKKKFAAPLIVLSILSGSAFALMNPTKVTLKPYLLNTATNPYRHMIDVLGPDFKLDKYGNAHLDYGNLRKFSIPRQTHHKLKNIANSVFPAKVKSFTADSHLMGLLFRKKEFYGTGFYLGNNKMLTTYKLVAPLMNQFNCKKLSFKLSPYKTATCQEIQYCHKKYDFCLIQVKNPYQASMDNYHTPLKLNESMNRKSLNKNPEYMNVGNHMLVNYTEKLYGIHNSLNKGLQASAGKMTMLTKLPVEGEMIDHLVHFSPIMEGGAGSPVLNYDGEVVGMTTYVRPADKKNDMSDYPQSIAIPVKLIKDAMKKAQKLYLLP